MSSLKSVLKKMVLTSSEPKTFPAVRMEENQVEEKVYVKSRSQECDVTKTHCIICHDPFLIAVYFEKKIEFDNDELIEFEIRRQNFICARATVRIDQTVEAGNLQIEILSISQVKCYQLDWLRQYALLRYFKNKDSIWQSKMYAALYSYPRQVIVVSYKDDNYFNIFPMDFQCYIEKEELIMLGLRTTNVTVDKMIQSKRVVISDSSNVSLETIYQLGRNHSKSPPSIAELPFTCTNSKHFEFPVPEFSASYKEVELVFSKKMGSHNFLVGRVINKTVLKSNASSIYHLHFFQSGKSNYPLV